MSNPLLSWWTNRSVLARLILVFMLAFILCWTPLIPKIDRSAWPVVNWAVASALLVIGYLTIRLDLAFQRSMRPSKPGTCNHCGYDLRATPDRCPECGTAVERPK